MRELVGGGCTAQSLRGAYRGSDRGLAEGIRFRPALSTIEAAAQPPVAYDHSKFAGSQPPLSESVPRL
jgi:hypothetical protein